MLKSKIALLGASWLALTGAAFAQEASNPDERAARIEALEQRLADLEAQLADLKESTAADSADVRRIQTEAPQVTLNNARPSFATSDNQFRFAVRGLAQYDVAHYEQDSPATPDNRRSDASNPGDLSSGSNFRRAASASKALPIATGITP